MFKNEKLLEKEGHLYVPGSFEIYPSIFRCMLCHFNHWLFYLFIIVPLFPRFFFFFFLKIAFDDTPAKIS